MGPGNPTASALRGIYTGAPLCPPRRHERFFQCPVCGGWVDSTDLAQMAEHEGELPPPAPLAEAS